MATIVPPPGASRAREILRDMREKRESLISSNPSLQSLQTGQKPPTVPRKRKENLIPSSPGSSRAREILGDLQQKRASLSAVLEACKASPGSPSSTGKRSLRSIGGPSTAPTAASTRSWLSSNADDDSFCYSDTSLEDSPKESSIEFIIDTEDSDFSLTTREEVEQAIDTIYEEVIPHALQHAKKQAMNTQSIETTSTKTTSWTFQTQSSARNLYREESFQVSKSKKKKRRTKISDKKKQLQSDKKNSSRSVASWASGLESVDMSEVRKQRSRLQEMMNSISELKECESLAPRNKSSRSIRRLRQDDASEGSAPISSSKSHRTKSSPNPPSDDTIKLDFDLSAMKEQSRRKKNASSSIASHYVIETKVKRGQKKKIAVKPSELYVAPTPDPDNIQSDSSVSECSLLASPKAPHDDEESLLVSPEQSEDEKSMPDERPKVDDVADKKSVPVDDVPDKKSVPNEQASVDVSYSTNQVICIPEKSSMDLSCLTDIHSGGSLVSAAQANNKDVNVSSVQPRVASELDHVLEFQSAESSAFMLFEDYKGSQDEPSTIIAERRHGSTMAAVVDRDPLDVSQRMELTPLEPRTGSTPPSEDNLMNYMKTYTMDDIVREMNIIAAKIGKEGLKIPSGTVLKLRHNNGPGVEDMEEDESATGWTFSEPSDISSCSYALPRKDSTRCAPDSTTVDSPGKPPARKARPVEKIDTTRKSRQAREDITERFCGGMYHLAVMTGMPVYEEQEV
mmetsp:Transcript_25846/g.43037  ORF Transcript_25846/g.43037 Transcript_25846/m.43037 type:complete len:739 (+) Transcript_25846:169-2385(+)|eukprot:CAMPEP_0119009058 /NCGR_PEP_ID=MMETSP1176-20130426/4113_1 /TAXON_ID=265551 /ORGANISM="Synedropsis recta cf, Strain CCMP1620" /LENGTH=738 /DNA_ID=CAMNT_0006961503 /DNA_START=169 /DNA_END=2385 /DNA_ORIENTATION=-